MFGSFTLALSFSLRMTDSLTASLHYFDFCDFIRTLSFSAFFFPLVLLVTYSPLVLLFIAIMRLWWTSKVDWLVHKITSLMLERSDCWNIKADTSRNKVLLNFFPLYTSVSFCSTLINRFVGFVLFWTMKCRLRCFRHYTSDVTKLSLLFVSCNSNVRIFFFSCRLTLLVRIYTSLFSLMIVVS